MSVAVVSSRAITGMAARAVTVEVHLANGLPGLSLVGLPDTEVKESRERVRSALQNSRFEFPARRITVNLAPADLPKASGCFDLPIALGILAASGQLPDTGLRSHEFAGELSLTGELRPVRGALAMASAMLAEPSARALVLPAASAQEAALVEGATVYGARTLLDVCAHLAEPDVATPLPRAVVPLALAASADSGVAQASDLPDLGDIKGQEHAKRTSHLVLRPTGYRQVDAGDAARGTAPGAEQGAGRGGRHAGQPERTGIRYAPLGPATVSRAASYGVGRGAGGRR